MNIQIIQKAYCQASFSSWRPGGRLGFQTFDTKQSSTWLEIILWQQQTQVPLTMCQAQLSVLYTYYSYLIHAIILRNRYY